MTGRLGNGDKEGLGYRGTGGQGDWMTGGREDYRGTGGQKDYKERGTSDRGTGVSVLLFPIPPIPKSSSPVTQIHKYINKI